MTIVGTQLKALLWKDFVLKTRSPVYTILCECLCPLGVLAMLSTIGILFADPVMVPFQTLENQAFPVSLFGKDPFPSNCFGLDPYSSGTALVGALFNSNGAFYGGTSGFNGVLFPGEGPLAGTELLTPLDCFMDSLSNLAPLLSDTFKIAREYPGDIPNPRTVAIVSGGVEGERFQKYLRARYRRKNFDHAMNYEIHAFMSDCFGHGSHGKTKEECVNETPADCFVQCTNDAAFKKAYWDRSTMGGRRRLDGEDEGFSKDMQEKMEERIFNPKTVKELKKKYAVGLAEMHRRRRLLQDAKVKCGVDDEVCRRSVMQTSSALNNDGIEAGDMLDEIPESQKLWKSLTDAGWNAYEKGVLAASTFTSPSATIRMLAEKSIREMPESLKEGFFAGNMPARRRLRAEKSRKRYTSKLTGLTNLHRNLFGSVDERQLQEEEYEECEDIKDVCACAEYRKSNNKALSCGWGTNWNRREREYETKCFSSLRRGRRRTRGNSRSSYYNTEWSTSCYDCESQPDCSGEDLFDLTLAILENLPPNVKVFESDEALDQWIKGENYPNDYTEYNEERKKDLQYTQELCMTIALDATEENLDYTIRMNATQNPSGEFKTRTRPLFDPRYATNSFVSQQNLVRDFAVCRSTPVGTSSIMENKFVHCLESDNFATDVGDRRELGGVIVAFMGMPEVWDNLLLVFGGPYFSRTWWLALVVALVPSLAGRIVTEKEGKLREGMKQMGLMDVIYYAEPFVFNMLWGAGLTTFVILELFNLPLMTRKSNWFLIWVFIYSVVIAMMQLTVFLTSFFSKALFGKIIVTMVFMIGWPLEVLKIQPDTTIRLFLSAVYPYFSLKYGYLCFVETELMNRGITWDTWNMAVEGVSMADAVTMNCVGIFVYTFLFYYFDQVVPGEYGTPRKWYFPVQPSFWMEAVGMSTVKKSAGGGKNESEKEAEYGVFVSKEEADADRKAGRIVGTKDRPCESASVLMTEMQRQNRAVEIQKITKKFGDFTAVDGLDLTMYEGEIFALLGHNGAGKTTLISMLSGLIPRTSGNANVFGTDLDEMLKTQSANVGICPQHSVLWDDLSVYEHLMLFAKFKGVPRDEAKKQAKNLLVEEGLWERRHALCGTLSGGMRRKTSLCIAFIGNPRIVFLDEPTSGMDTLARQHAWASIKQRKEGRVIILTTHYMDEADILGDRVAIMAHGQICCCGTGAFLKKEYGCGYNMTFILKQNSKLASDEVASGIVKFLNRYIPGNRVRLFNCVGSELLLLVPFEATVYFERLFEELELKRDELDVVSWGLMVCNLEEVFLKVASNEGVHSTKKDTALDNVTSNLRAGSDNVTSNLGVISEGAHSSADDCGVSTVIADCGGSEATNIPNNRRHEIDGESNAGHNLGAVSDVTNMKLEEPREALVNDLAEDVLPKGTVLSPSFTTTMHAMLYKRLIVAKRDKLISCFQCFCPVLYILFYMIVIWYTIGDEPKYSLDVLSHYNIDTIHDEEEKGKRLSTPYAFAPNFRDPKQEANTGGSTVEDGIAEIRRALNEKFEGFEYGFDVLVDDDCPYEAVEGELAGCESGLALERGLNSLAPTRWSSDQISRREKAEKERRDSVKVCRVEKKDEYFNNVDSLVKGLGRLCYERRNETDYNVFVRLLATVSSALTASVEDGGVIASFDISSFVGDDAASMLTGAMGGGDPAGDWRKAVRILSYKLDQDIENWPLRSRYGFYFLPNPGTGAINPSSPEEAELGASRERNPFSRAIVMVNGTGIHALPIYMNQLYNQEIEYQGKSGRLSVNMHSLPQTTYERKRRMRWFVWDAANSLMFAFGFITVFTLAFVVFERQTEIKEQQFINGVTVFQYWLSNLLFDCIWFSFPAVFCVSLCAYFGLEPLVGDRYVDVFLWMFTFFILAHSVFNYLVAYSFRSADEAITGAMFMNLFICPVVMLFILIGSFYPDPDTRYWSFAIHVLFLPWPLYAFGSGLQTICTLWLFWDSSPPETRPDTYWAECEVMAEKWEVPRYMCAQDVWDIDYAAGSNAIVLCVSFFVYFMVVVVWDYTNQSIQLKMWLMNLREKFYPTKQLPEHLSFEKDADVIAEENLAKSLSREEASKYGMFMKNVKKIYRVLNKPEVDEEEQTQSGATGEAKVQQKKGALHTICFPVMAVFRKLNSIYLALFGKRTFVHAVQGVSFTLEKGAVFGLLGMNGAGKTTLFRLMCAILAPQPPKKKGLKFEDDDYEDIQFEGQSLLGNQYNCVKEVGYCSQQNPLWHNLTCREHVYIYSKIKGVPPELINAVVEEKLDRMDLSIYHEKWAGNLSGGNKRKLCVAMCLTGKPQVVYLDEPSAGMDPKARRVMWQIIQRISSQDKDTTTVLTTHSMEECEALCSKTCIMANGRFRCIGSNQHIKSVYGKGFDLVIKFRDLIAIEIAEMIDIWGLTDAVKACETSQEQGTTLRISYNDLKNMLFNIMKNRQSGVKMDRKEEIDVEELAPPPQVAALAREFSAASDRSILGEGMEGVDEFLLQQLMSMYSPFPAIARHGGEAVLISKLTEDQQHEAFQDSVSVLVLAEWAIHTKRAAMFTQWAERMFSSSKIVERRAAGRITYRVELGSQSGEEEIATEETKKIGTLGQVFGRIEACKENMRIQEYSISPTTLEQIFMELSREPIANVVNSG